MDGGQFQSKVDQIAFLTVWDNENTLHRTRDIQMIHMPMRMLIGAQMVP